MGDCRHPRISWISQDMNPPIVSGVCLDCGEGFDPPKPYILQTRIQGDKVTTWINGEEQPCDPS